MHVSDLMKMGAILKREAVSIVATQKNVFLQHHIVAKLND